MPSISAMVAQVNAVCPSAAWRAASAVHLCALTWGRSSAPGNASAIVRRLASRRAASTTSAGVVSSVTFTAARLRERPRTWPGVRSDARVLSALVSTPWMGDACSLVDAFRARELSPLEALDACIAAIDDVAAQRVQLHRLRAGPGRSRPRRRDPAVRRGALRRQGAREGEGLARTPRPPSSSRIGLPVTTTRRWPGCARPAPCWPRRRRPPSSAASTARRPSCTAPRATRGTRSARLADRRAARPPPWPADCCRSPPGATVVVRSGARPASAASSG